MTEPAFDAEGLFDDDYLYFFSDALEERSDAETDLIWNLLDRIVSWFTAFGYFDDPGNREVLAQAARALKPGGQLAIEMNNYLRLARNYLPSVVVERDGNLVVPPNTAA